MRTPDSPAFKALKTERRRLASLRRVYGGLDNRWTAAMIEQAEDSVFTLEWQVAEERKAAKREKQRKADYKRRYGRFA
jgi:hypothetical protein